MSESFAGLLVVDKPSGPTSRQALDRVKRWFPRGTAVGHTGTLDPLASGVLVVCVGWATRLAEYVQGMDKTYRTTFLLGHRSDTDDVLGNVEAIKDARPVDWFAVDRVRAFFWGEMEQVPPAYSAAKVGGRRAYKLARQGKTVSLQPRRVRIHSVKLLDFHYPRVEYEISCSKGTYIRALARDIGKWLGSGAIVETLRRTRVGVYHEEDAIPLDASSNLARSKLQNPTGAVVLETDDMVWLTEEEAENARHGQAITPASGAEIKPSATEVALIGSDRRLVGIGIWDAEHGVVRPKKIFPETAR